MRRIKSVSSMLLIGVLSLTLVGCNTGNREQSPPPSPFSDGSSVITDESEVSIEEQKSNSIHIVGAKYAVLTEGESCHYEVKIKDIYGDAELKEDKHIEDLYNYKIEETDDGCTLTLTGGKTSGKCNIWLESETGVKSETITLEVNKKEESKTEQSKPEVSKAEESKIEESETEQSNIEESEAEQSKIEESKVEVVNKKDVDYEITDRYFNVYDDNTKYTAWVEIKNTGSKNLYIKDCVFDFEDENGKLLGTEDFIDTYPEVIRPEEKAYCYEHGDLTAEAQGKNVQFVPKLDIVKATKDPVYYDVFDDKMTTDGSSTEIIGRVKNNTGEDEGYFYVSVALFDENGRFIWGTGTSVSDLDADKTVSFDIKYIDWDIPDDIAQKGYRIASYKINTLGSYYQW